MHYFFVQVLISKLNIFGLGLLVVRNNFKSLSSTCKFFYGNNQPVLVKNQHYRIKKKFKPIFLRD